jgi:hypothetical protein
MNTDLKNETQAEPVSATVQSGSVSIPFWVIDYAQKIELFMKVNGVDAWALGGIQSRDFPPAPQPQAEPVGEWVMVPREPTPAMAEAMARNAVDGDFDKDLSNGIKEKCVRLAASDYRAALAAAPQQQVDQTDWHRIARVQSAKLAAALNEPGAQERLDAALLAWKQPSPQPQAEPVGEWVMVPREPTDAMTTSALYEADVSTEVAAKAWAAMLAAAPQPQASAEDVAHMERIMQRAYFYPEDVAAWQRIEADMNRLLGVGRE